MAYFVSQVCVQVTEEFLAFSKEVGNDLSTPMPMYLFPGLQPGDRWCLCAQRWTQVKCMSAVLCLDLDVPVRMTSVSLPLVQIPGPGSRVCAQSVPTGDAREDAAGTGSTPQTIHTRLLTLLLYGSYTLLVYGLLTLLLYGDDMAPITTRALHRSMPTWKCSRRTRLTWKKRARRKLPWMKSASDSRNHCKACANLSTYRASWMANAV